MDVENVLDWAVLDHGYYQREVLDAIMASIPDNGILWDVGANVGLHAITTKRLKPEVTVVAFEPAPHTAARLIANADLNRAEVRVVTCALSDTSGIAELSIVTHGNSGLTSLRPWPDVRYEGTIMCPCARADELVRSGALPAPNVLKLDVEGFEAEVLRGFGELLTAPSLTAVIFEGTPEAPAVPDSLFTIIRRAGYRIEALRPRDPREASSASNYLATRT